MRISDWSSDVCASYLPVGPDDELDHDAPVVGAASSLDLISFSSLRKLAISPRSACSSSSSMPRLTAIGFGFVTAKTKPDRKSVVWGKHGSGQGDIGGMGVISKKTNTNTSQSKL